MNWFLHISYGHFLILAVLLFTIGAVGVLVRKNALIMLMSVELMLNAGNIAILTFARLHGDMRGHNLAFIVIAVAAAEAAIGLAIVVQLFRTTAHVEVDKMTELKG